MAQWNRNTQEYNSNNSVLFEANMPVDQYGRHIISPQLSAFGEQISVPITPVVQLDAIYGLDPTVFETFTNANGTATHANSHFSITATSDANSYGVLRSKRFIRYRPGQGCLARFTASYTSNPIGFTQRAGLFNQEQALQIGYDHTNGKFGILRANGGKAHIHNILFTSLANGNITLTLNGTTFSAVTVSGGTIASNIAALVAGLKLQSTFNALYNVEYNGDDITFLSTSLGPKTGTTSVTSTGTVTYTQSILQTGITQTENWTYQEDWNYDKLDGTGTSGVILDKTKLNVYQIDFRWLGAGEIRFSIENPSNGDIIPFHHIHYSNTYNIPHLDNPSLKIGYVCANLGNPGSGSVEMRAASLMGGIQGNIVITSNPQAAIGNRSDTLASGSIYHLLTIKNKLVYRDKINTRDLIIKTISAGVTAVSSAPATLYLYYSPTLSNNFLWKDMGPFNASSYSDAAITITSPPQPIAIYQLSSGGPINIDISNLDLHIPPQAYLTIGIASSSNITASSAAATFVED